MHRDAQLASRPFGLVVDPINACTLHCPGCVHTSNPVFRDHFDWPPARLQAAQMSVFLERFAPYALAILMYSYGEPLLNPLTSSYCAAAKRYRLATVVSTSLSLPIDAEQLVTSPIDRIIISIDGVTESVYREFRRGGDLSLVLRNLADLVRARDRHAEPTPHLQWQFLTFEHNIGEVERALELAEKMGVDSLNVVTPYDVSWDDPEIRVARSSLEGLHTFRYPSVASGADFHNPLRAEVVEREFRRSWSSRGRIDAGGRAEVARVGSDDTCAWLYKNICMDAVGRILPCACAPTYDANRVFANDLGTQGDPFNSSLYRQAREFFSNPQRFAVRAVLTGNSSPPACVGWGWSHHIVDVDLSDCRPLLRSFDRCGLLDRASIALLTDW
jgi:MoaA/NifB/PqqE/SkfB family radical SAM enzyme